MKYFEAVTIPNSSKFSIAVIHDNLPFNYTGGSYNVFGARLFNLTFPSYLRMCRDLFDAEIVGKGHGYPVLYFKTEPKELVKELNLRMTKLMAYFSKV